MLRMRHRAKGYLRDKSEIKEKVDRNGTNKNDKREKEGRVELYLFNS